jgi:glycogen operon protein
MLSTLMLSQGVPMILMGDECRRTQSGNNNAYCQDNEISWFDWRLTEKNAGLVRFVSCLIKFRRGQPTVRRKRFLTGMPAHDGALPDVSWYNALGVAVDWHSDILAFIAILTPPHVEDDPQHLGRSVMLLANSTNSPREFIVPAIAKGVKWRLFADTAAESPNDVYPDFDGPLLAVTRRMMLKEHSLCCFVADK